MKSDSCRLNSICILTQTREKDYTQTNIYKFLQACNTSSFNFSVYAYMLHHIGAYSLSFGECVGALSIFKSPFLSLSASRNAAFHIAYSRHYSDTFYFFIDDDCMPKNLEHAVKYLTLLRKYNTVFLATGPISTIETGRPFNRHVLLNTHSTRLKPHNYKSFLGACVYSTAETILSLGCFNISLGLGSIYGGSEDTDLFLKAQTLGIPVLSDSNLSILHPEIKHLQYSFSKMYSYGIGRGFVLAKFFSVFPVTLFLSIITELLGNLLIAFFALALLRFSYSHRHLGLLCGKISGINSYISD